MSDELAQLDATAQAEKVRSGELTPAEMIDAAIVRLEKLNPRLGAVIHLGLERARQRAASPQLEDGPFRGVPFLMKDVGGDEAGQPQHAGMRALKEAAWCAPANSYFVDKAEQAGLVSLGRTNSPELALLPTSEPEAYGPTRNPWSLEHSSGGSSGGAASAVAAGIVAAAHGSDGGGSIRGPASMCGLVGLKPTRARTSFGPGLGERWSSLSSEFVLTRSVRDTAALLDVFGGPMPGDPYAAPPPQRPYRDEVGAPPGRLRIGYMAAAPRALELHADCRAAAEKTARLLESLGHEVELAYPEALDEPASVASYVSIVSSNVARQLDVTAEKIGRPLVAEDVEPLTWALAERGRSLNGGELIAAIESTHGFGRRLAGWWEQYDLLLTPTQAAPPPQIGWVNSTREEPVRAFVRAAPYGVFTLPFNLSGQPAISLPLHWNDAGLPIGSQLVGGFGGEDVLLRVAAQLEQAEPWSAKRAPLHA